MRGAILCVMLAGWCAALGGCNRLVGRMDYVRSSMSPDLHTAHVEPARYEPLRPAPFPREGLRLPPLYDETLDDERDVTRAVPRLRGDAVFAAVVHLELQSIRADLLRVATLADQRGMAGRAALDPKLRNFNTSVRLIERYLTDYRGADQAERDSLRTKIHMQLRDARNAVREALEDVQRVQDRGRLLTSLPPGEQMLMR